jgi:hypothetical protein
LSFLTCAGPIDAFRIENPIQCFLETAHPIHMPGPRGWLNVRNGSKTDATLMSHLGGKLTLRRRLSDCTIVG